MADATPETPVATDDMFTFESTTDKKYPLCPEGVQRVIVDKAIFEMKDAHPKAPVQGKVPCITLWLSTLDAKYDDPQTKQQRNYRLFKTLKVSDHSKSNMFEFFQKVCGTPVPLREKKLEDGTTVKRIYIGPRTVVQVKDAEDEVHYPQFEHLEFSVSIAHEKKEDGTKKDKVDSTIACSPVQKGLNAVMFATE